MLIIYTRPNNIFTKEYMKHVVSCVIKKLRGPRAVLESMRHGLDELHIPYLVNPPYNKIKHEDIVHVVSGVETLRECIDLKKNGSIKKLIAGPSVTVIPGEEQGLLLDSNIDSILVPSSWVKNLYTYLNPELLGKVFVWFSGVRDCKLTEQEVIEKKNDYLIYCKNTEKLLLEYIEVELTKQHKSFKKVIYGEFKQSEFFKMLSTSKAMIYLSPSESQGLALNEAWMRDVPTLVLDCGYWKYKDIVWTQEKISAPYLTDDLGITFNSEIDFVQKLSIFEKKYTTYRPRAYSLENFTDTKSIQLLLNILEVN